MTVGNPAKIILKFMLPLFLGNVFQQLYNMADTIIVGRFVGPDALAAVGSTGTIMFLILGFSQGLTGGFTVLTSQSFGAGDLPRVRHSVANAIILSVIVTVLMTVLSTSLMYPLLKLMNTPDNIFRDAYTYIMIISAGIFAAIFNNLFSSFIRAVGNSRVPLYFLMFSAGLNVFLDLLLIIRFQMGVAGAAIATVISQGLSAFFCLIYIMRSMKILRPEKTDWHLAKRDTEHQIRVGMPMALQFAITASGTIIMQAAINLFGSTAVAAYTAANKIQNVLTQEMISMGQAMATYSGQNYGKGDAVRISDGVKAALVIDTVYSVLAGIFIVSTIFPLLHLFFSAGADFEKILPYANTYVRISAIFYVPLSYIFVFRNTMQGCGFGFLPMMGGVVEFFARLVVAAAAMTVLSYGLAVFCDPFAWLCAAVFTGAAYHFVIRRIRKQLGPSPDSDGNIL